MEKARFLFNDLATSALLKLEIYNRLQGDKLGFFQAGHNCRWGFSYELVLLNFTVYFNLQNLKVGKIINL